MQHFQFSRPDHDLLVRRVAAGLLEGTLRPSDVDGRTDRQVRDWMARHASTAGDTRVSAPVAPV